MVWPCWKWPIRSLALGWHPIDLIVNACGGGLRDPYPSPTALDAGSPGPGSWGARGSWYQSNAHIHPERRTHPPCARIRSRLQVHRPRGRRHVAFFPADFAGGTPLYNGGRHQYRVDLRYSGRSRQWYWRYSGFTASYGQTLSEIWIYSTPPTPHVRFTFPSFHTTPSYISTPRTRIS